MAKCILFVCTGNTCRSPMAEGFLKKILQDKKVNDITVQSGGVFASDGFPASTGAILVLAEMGVDISSHKSSRIRADVLDNADSIIVMERNHRDALLKYDPSLEPKIKLLKEFSNASPIEMDVEDPIGGSPDQYRDCALVIHKCVQRLADELISERKAS